jgi:hypothetical protein
LETAFCKRYHTVQNDEQVYMALRVIKHGSDEKVEVYYERILKVANCLQHKVDDSLLTTFFFRWVGPLLANYDYKNEIKHLI